jgi:hypothetical protein
MVLQGRPLVLLFSEATAAYGLRLSQKLTLQAVPLVGAAGGALVNGAFVAHFESLARAHFVIRRLERTFGAQAVREAAAALQTPDAEMHDGGDEGGRDGGHDDGHDDGHDGGAEAPG